MQRETMLNDEIEVLIALFRQPHIISITADRVSFYHYQRALTQKFKASGMFDVWEGNLLTKARVKKTYKKAYKIAMEFMEL